MQSMIETKIRQAVDKWACGCVENTAYDNYSDTKEMPYTIEEFAEAIYYEVMNDKFSDRNFHFYGKARTMALAREAALRHVKELVAEGYRFPNIPEAR